MSRAAWSGIDARQRRDLSVPGSWTGGSPDGGTAFDEVVEAVFGVLVAGAVGVRVWRFRFPAMGVVWAGWCPCLEVELLESVALVLAGWGGGVDVSGWGEPWQAGGGVEVDPPLGFL